MRILRKKSIWFQVEICTEYAQINSIYPQKTANLLILSNRLVSRNFSRNSAHKRINILRKAYNMLHCINHRNVFSILLILLGKKHSACTPNFLLIVNLFFFIYFYFCFTLDRRYKTKFIPKDTITSFVHI